MKREEFSLVIDGLSVRGELLLPDADENPRLPALVLCHGIPQAIPQAEAQSYLPLARRFCQAGFITAIFNFRGTGKSEGNLDMMGWAKDLKTVIDHLWETPEVDRRRLYVLGSSAGAAVSVYLAARDRRIKALVTLACPADFNFIINGGKAQAFLSHLRSTGLIRNQDFPESLKRWEEGFLRVSPIEYINKISPRPLLLIHGELDEVVPQSHAYALFEKAQQPKELVLLPGATHRLRLDERAVEMALEYLVQRAK